MEIKTDKSYSLRKPKLHGGYLLIKNPTPEVLDLLEQMRKFAFTEDGVVFRMICKGPQRFEYEDPGDYASVGWKIALSDRTSTIEERVKEIQ